MIIFLQLYDFRAGVLHKDSYGDSYRIFALHPDPDLNPKPDPVGICSSKQWRCNIHTSLSLFQKCMQLNVIDNKHIAYLKSLQTNIWLCWNVRSVIHFWLLCSFHWHICLTYPFLQFDCIIDCIIYIFAQSPWSRLCCICLFKFVIITLHYITGIITNCKGGKHDSCFRLFWYN